MVNTKLGPENAEDWRSMRLPEIGGIISAALGAAGFMATIGTGLVFIGQRYACARNKKSVVVMVITGACLLGVFFLSAATVAWIGEFLVRRATDRVGATVAWRLHHTGLAYELLSCVWIASTWAFLQAVEQRRARRSDGL